MEAENTFQVTSAGSSLAQADPPFVRRLKIVFSALSNYTIKTGNERTKRNAWIMNAIMEEVFIELEDADEGQAAEWFGQFGQIMQWIATGNPESLPETVRPYLAPESVTSDSEVVDAEIVPDDENIVRELIG